MSVYVYGMGAQFFSDMERLYKSDHLVSFLSNVAGFVDIAASGQKTLFEKQVIPYDDFLKEVQGKTDELLIYIASPKFYGEILSQLQNALGLKENQFLSLAKHVETLCACGGPFVEHLNPALCALPEFQEHVKRFGTLPQRSIDGCRLLVDRYAALSYMPKGGVVGEVGVAYGDYSKHILDELTPQKFHAMDYFDETTRGFWGDDRFYHSKTTHRAWYENRFSEGISSGLIDIHQGFSWDCIGGFPDNYFDYLYIDAAHDYTSVKRDIAAAKSKIKVGGFIQFNDYGLKGLSYLNEYGKGILPYGVMYAVNEMLIHDNRFVMRYYCLHPATICDVVIERLS